MTPTRWPFSQGAVSTVTVSILASGEVRAVDSYRLAPCGGTHPEYARMVSCSVVGLTGRGLWPAFITAAHDPCSASEQTICPPVPSPATARGKPRTTALPRTFENFREFRPSCRLSVRLLRADGLDGIGCEVPTLRPSSKWSQCETTWRTSQRATRRGSGMSSRKTLRSLALSFESTDPVTRLILQNSRSTPTGNTILSYGERAV